MEDRTKAPAVEQQYEDPPPREQSLWNIGIFGTVLIVAIIFIGVILYLIFD